MLNIKAIVMAAALVPAIPNCDGGGDRSCKNTRTNECYDVTNCTTCNTAGAPWNCVNNKCPGGGFNGYTIDLTPMPNTTDVFSRSSWTASAGLDDGNPLGEVDLIAGIQITMANGEVVTLDGNNVTMVRLRFGRLAPTEAQRFQLQLAERWMQDRMLALTPTTATPAEAPSPQ